MPLKSPEIVVRNALVTNADVTAAIGSRVYPVIGPASAVLPFLTYRRANVARVQHMGGPYGVTTVVLEVDVFASTYESAREVAEVCRKALDGQGFVHDNTTVLHVTLENEVDGYGILQGGEVPPAYSVTLTFSVLWKET